MPSCHVCSNIITKSVCLYQKNAFHLECCKLCVAQSAPKQSETAKSKAGPGRLNFGKIGSFEKKDVDVKCYTCKKAISGQKFLTHKVGEFDCKSCFSKRVESCSKCSEPFGTGDEILKDEKENKYCEKCFKEVFKEAKPIEIPVITTIHCDKCTVKVESDKLINHKGFHYHKSCFECVGCKKKMQDDEVDLLSDDKDQPFCFDCYTNFHRGFYLKKIFFFEFLILYKLNFEFFLFCKIN